MNAYMVYEDDYESTLIYGIYSSRELAENRLAELGKTYPNVAKGWVQIAEIELNKDYNGFPTL
jgi:hypothetical protein